MNGEQIMKKIFVSFLFLLCYCFSLESASFTGNTRSFLKEIPFETLVQLYSRHEEAQKDPELIQFARFFENNRDLFYRIIQAEEASTQNYYILYHGVNGQRLLFDTLRVLYNQTHQTALPQDFILLRDPRDPAVRTANLQKTLSTRWPLIPLTHKKIIIEAIIHEPVTVKQVPLLWALLSGDIDWNQDLSPADRALLNRFSQDSILEHQHYFLSLAHMDWKDPKSVLTKKEKKELMAMDTQISSLGYELALRALYILENNVDYSPLFRPQNLAVNLSLFSGCIAYNPALGLHPTKHECTPLYWFAENLGYHQFEAAKTLRDEKLSPILERYGIPQSELQTLETIYQTLQPEDDQLLLQIFVPKDLHKQDHQQRALNRFFYISHPVGRPAYYLGPLFASQVLDRYQNSLGFLPAFLQLQGRFVFTEEGLLNPQSGIRMRVYQLPSASSQRIERYLFLLNQWAMHQNLKTDDPKFLRSCFSKKSYIATQTACRG